MSKIEKQEKKIVVKKDEKQITKEEREARIKENKNKKTKVSLEDVFQYLNDTNSRIEEIYDLVKS